MVTKKTTKRQDLYRFKIPFAVYFIQSLLNFLITLILPLIPFIILVLIVYFFRNMLNTIIISFSGVIACIISLTILLKFYIGFEPVKSEFYRNFREVFYRKFVVNKLRCPNCQGKFIGSGRLKPMAQLFCEYSYFCGSCKNEYVPKVVNDNKGVRTLWKLAKFSQSKNKT